MTFWAALKATYQSSWAFLIACPLLALVPVAFELLQHIVEARIGMYDSVAHAKALEHHPARMTFGLLKVASLTLPIYWVTRYVASRDPSFAAKPDGKAVRLFVPYLLFSLTLAGLQLLLLSQAMAVALATFLIGWIIGSLVPAWAVAASLGNETVGLRRSVAIMGRHLPWTFAFMFVAMLPLMVPHYGLGALALLGPKPLLWPVLILDSLLVGWLAAVLPASGYYAAVRAAGEQGVDLAPDQDLTAGSDLPHAPARSPSL